MVHEFQIRVQPHEAANEQSLKRYIAREKGMDERTITAVRVLRRSIDARQRIIYMNLTVRVFVNEMPQMDEYVSREYGNVEGRQPVIVVGAGPAGLFAALKLIENGIRPIVVERGRDVRARKLDLAQISRTHKVNPESNYCFGEGGAGAYSDGKLYTRSKKRGSIEGVLNIFCQHGASPTILADAHPHIGTDKLPRIIENIRNRIIECGGEVRFETRMEELLIKDNKVCGIRTDKGEILAPAVILATGHSAKDVYRTLHAGGIALEAKGFAVGVRLEHPSELIDRIQYHSPNGRGKYLPAAEYSFTTQVDGRGVYSFCMCPGGVVVPATSEEGGIVTNGMSEYARMADNSNAAFLVSVTPSDFGSEDVLSGLALQRSIEKKAFKIAGANYKAPATTMNAFMHREKANDFPTVKPSYALGVESIAPEEYLPEFITESIREAIPDFDDWMRGFYYPEAVLTGPETRTTSPIRVKRNENFESVTISGLYPAGEGAGYSGGIVSSARDGLVIAEKILEKYQK